MPGTVKSIIVGGGIRASGGGLDQFVIFADSDSPPGTVTGGNQIQTSEAVPKVYIGTVTRSANIDANVTIFGGAVIIQDSASALHHFVAGHNTSLDISAPPPAGSGNDCVVIGPDLTVTGSTQVAGAVVIGAGTSVTGTSWADTIMIGSASTITSASSGTVAIGNGLTISVSDNSMVVIGFGATRSVSGGSGCVMVGSGTVGSGTRIVAVGAGAEARGGDSTAVGDNAECLNNDANFARQIAIGSAASAGTGQRTTCIGYSATNPSNFADSLAIGHYAVITAANQIVLGNCRQPASSGGPATQLRISDVAFPSYAGLTFICTNGSGTDNAVGNLTFVAPRSTGNAGSGSDAAGCIAFSTGITGASGASVQTDTTRVVVRQGGGLQINATDIAGRANLLLLQGGSPEPAAIEFSGYTDQAAAGAGTLANAPTAGDPTFWIPIRIGGVAFAIPAWPV